MISEQATSYGYFAIALHWISVAAIFSTVPLGFATAIISLSAGPSGRHAVALKSLISTHPATAMSVICAHIFLGILILLLTSARLFWILSHGRPSEPPSQPRWQTVTAHSVHWMLYALLLILPISGIILVLISGLVQFLTGAVAGPIPGLFKFWPSSVHSLAAFTFIFLIIIHTAAGLYHQYYKRDALFSRMGVGRDH